MAPGFIGPAQPTSPRGTGTGAQQAQIELPTTAASRRDAQAFASKMRKLTHASRNTRRTPSPCSVRERRRTTTTTPRHKWHARALATSNTCESTCRAGKATGTQSSSSDNTHTSRHAALGCATVGGAMRRKTGKRQTRKMRRADACEHMRTFALRHAAARCQPETAPDD
jgi:hypothetical protein